MNVGAHEGQRHWIPPEAGLRESHEPPEVVSGPEQEHYAGLPPSLPPAHTVPSLVMLGPVARSLCMPGQQPPAVSPRYPTLVETECVASPWALDALPLRLSLTPPG